jgi:ADP-ribose pyrophosphatase YjhB (NUDIX family)
MEQEFKTPIPVVSCAVINKDHILLLKRAIEPFPGKWAFPAGHVEPGESAEASIIREVKEETNLDLNVRYLFSMGREVENGQAYLSMTFIAHTENEQVTIDEESLDWKWVPLKESELEKIDWAFPNHRKAAFQLSQSPVS